MHLQAPRVWGGYRRHSYPEYPRHDLCRGSSAILRTRRAESKVIDHRKSDRLWQSYVTSHENIGQARKGRIECREHVERGEEVHKYRKKTSREWIRGERHQIDLILSFVRMTGGFRWQNSPSLTRRRPDARLSKGMSSCRNPSVAIASAGSKLWSVGALLSLQFIYDRKRGILNHESSNLARPTWRSIGTRSEWRTINATVERWMALTTFPTWTAGSSFSYIAHASAMSPWIRSSTKYINDKESKVARSVVREDKTASK